MAHKFDPAHKNRLLDPERREWNDPDKILQYLNLGQCTVLADIGCGPGYLALEAARKMAPGGYVFAVDVSEEMVRACQANAEAAGIRNIECLIAEDDDEFPIHSELCDAALLANVYHEVDPTSNVLNELRRILKPGGIVLVMEWKREPTPKGPPQDERLDQQDVVEEFSNAGFILFGTCDVGPYHYGLKFYKRKAAEEPVPTMNDVVPG